MGTIRTTPTWKVQVVSDDGCCSECCGGGDPAPRTPRDESPGAFAYTIGLHERGAPELHLWARPTEGDDPGADWSFSPQDMVVTLNELAEEVLAGRLAVGDSHSETYDGGEATVTFRLGAAVDRMAVDAFGASPAASVVPVRWSLSRPPEGVLGPADPVAVLAAQSILAGLGPRPSEVSCLPPSWRVDDLAFDPLGELGPMTPLVRALAAALLGGDRDQLARFLVECASGYTTGTSAGHVVALARSTARRTGRSAALDAVAGEIGSLVVGVTDCPSWPSVVADAVDGLGGDWPAGSAVMPGVLGDGLMAVLATAVVHDVAERDLLLAGTGPFRWSRSPIIGAPREFLAPADVVTSVARTLGRLRPEDLRIVLGRHDRTTSDDGYLSACAHLQGLAVPSATALGSIGDVLSPAVVAEAVRHDLVASAWEWARLVVGAACAVRADPPRLSVELTEAFCAPYDDQLPGLRDLLGLRPH